MEYGGDVFNLLLKTGGTPIKAASNFSVTHFCSLKIMSRIGNLFLYL